jgi:hypothetical protein
LKHSGHTYCSKHCYNPDEHQHVHHHHH